MKATFALLEHEEADLDIQIELLPAYIRALRAIPKPTAPDALSADGQAATTDVAVWPEGNGL